MKPYPKTKEKKEEKSGQPEGILTYTVTSMSARDAQGKHLKKTPPPPHTRKFL